MYITRFSLDFNNRVFKISARNSQNGRNFGNLTKDFSCSVVDQTAILFIETPGTIQRWAKWYVKNDYSVHNSKSVGSACSIYDWSAYPKVENFYYLKLKVTFEIYAYWETKLFVGERWHIYCNTFGLLRTLKSYEGNYSVIDRQTMRLLVIHIPGKIYPLVGNFWSFFS